MSGDRFEHDVFVGYAGPDRAVARALHAELLDRGIDAFLDETLAPGEVWPQALPRAVRGSRVFAGVISDRSSGSWYLLDEIADAIKQVRDDPARRTVPVVLGGAELPYGMRSLQPIRLSDPPTATELAEAATALAGLVAPTDGAAPPSPSVVVDPPPLPPLPETPYPLLEPYRHPQLFAGRDAERDRLLDALRRPYGPAVILLRAPTGVGKSSLLRAGVVPGLRGQLGDGAAPVPVALTDHPDASGVDRELLGQLISTPALDIEDWTTIARVFDDLAGPTPVCVLDQFEAVFLEEDEHALARVGQLIAATVLDRQATRARWVLAYREDFHGRVLDWAEDILQSSRRLGWTVDGLRINLDRAGQTLEMSLPPFGSAPAGASPEAELAAARSAFLDTIERPWRIEDAMWPFTVEPSSAAALATALAEARVGSAGRAEPLLPTLQVVLSRLTALADAQGVTVLRLSSLPDGESDNVSAARSVLHNAMATHLRQALDRVCAAFRTRDREAAEHVLLALHRLVDTGSSHGANTNNFHRPVRGPGLSAEALASRIGLNGEQIIKELNKHRHRILVVVPADDLSDKTRLYQLSHDLIAEAIVAEMRRLREHTDEGSPLQVEALVASRTWAYREGVPGATELTPEQHAAVALAADKSVDSRPRRAWWSKANADFERRRHQRERQSQRTALFVCLALLAALAAGWVVKKLHGQRVDSERTAEIAVRVLTGTSEDWTNLVAEVDARRSPEAVVATLPLLPDMAVLRLVQSPVTARTHCGLKEALVQRFSTDARLPSDFGHWLYAVERFPGRRADSSCTTEQLAARRGLIERMRARYGPAPPSLLAALQPRAVPPLPFYVPTGRYGTRFVCGALKDVEGDGMTISVQAFTASQSEVTNGQMEVLMHAAGLAWTSKQGGGGRPSPEAPAVSHWADAAAFATWVGGRLPTEAEWTCLGRAGSIFDDQLVSRSALVWPRGSRGFGQLRDELTHGHPWGFMGMRAGAREWLSGSSPFLGWAVPLQLRTRRRAPDWRFGVDNHHVRAIGHSGWSSSTSDRSFVKVYPSPTHRPQDVGFRVAWDPPAR